MSTSRTREKADGELFKSTGIDDNATSTAITIDASENVGIGTATTYGKATIEHAKGINNGLTLAVSDATANDNITGIQFSTNSVVSRPRAAIYSKSVTSQGVAGWGADLIFATRGAPDASTISESDARMRIDSGGNVTVNNGNLVIGTNGKGIDFSANADSSATGASTTSELLDDYEEGTWTPAYTGSSTSGQTYSAQEGSYTKIGRVVHIQAWVKVTNKGTMGGPIRISGFPFTVSPTNQCAVSIGYTNGYNLTAGNNLQLWAYSDSFVYLFQAGGTNNSAHITTGDLDTEVWTAIGGTYHTNA